MADCMGIGKDVLPDEPEHKTECNTEQRSGNRHPKFQRRTVLLFTDERNAAKNMKHNSLDFCSTSFCNQ